jgi:response regulator RpfG family c-di-GMP phosphodiesterase
VLVVDDDLAVLDGLRRRLHGRFDVTCAHGGNEALHIIASKEPFVVVVSDMRMPGMDGAALLEHVRVIQPDAIRVLLTGNTDIDGAMAAVNRGQVFRFLCKPCDGETLIKALEGAVAQHRLVTAERELLEKTLRGSVQALVETLSLAAPGAFARAVRIKDVVAGILNRLASPERWDIEVASMLSQLGACTLPDTTIDKLRRGEELATEEEAMVARLPGIADRLLAGIPRLEGVRRMIREQHAPATENDVSIGGRVLRAAVEYETLVASGTSHEVAVATLRRRYGEADEEIFTALAESSAGPSRTAVREVLLDEVVPGMTLQCDVRSAAGALVVARGQVVTESLAERLRNFAAHNTVTETVLVDFVDFAGADGPEVPSAGLPGRWVS